MYRQERVGAIHLSHTLFPMLLRWYDDLHKQLLSSSACRSEVLVMCYLHLILQRKKKWWASVNVLIQHYNLLMSLWFRIFVFEDVLFKMPKASESLKDSSVFYIQFFLYTYHPILNISCHFCNGTIHTNPRQFKKIKPLPNLRKTGTVKLETIFIYRKWNAL